MAGGGAGAPHEGSGAAARDESPLRRQGSEEMEEPLVLAPTEVQLPVSLLAAPATSPLQCRALSAGSRSCARASEVVAARGGAFAKPRGRGSGRESGHGGQCSLCAHCASITASVCVAAGREAHGGGHVLLGGSAGARRRVLVGAGRLGRAGARRPAGPRPARLVRRAACPQPLPALRFFTSACWVACPAPHQLDMRGWLGRVDALCRVAALSGVLVERVSCGQYHTTFVARDGTVWGESARRPLLLRIPTRGSPRARSGSTCCPP